MSSDRSFSHYLPPLLILAAASALAFTVQAMVVTSGALLGTAYATNKFMTTLPIASQLLGVVISLKWVAGLIDRYGIKRAFLTGILCGVVGGLVLALGIYINSFGVICLGLFIAGVQAATSSYYRFAAADLVPAHYKPRAVSIVVFGSIAAAFIGPKLSVHGHDWIKGYAFMGVGLWIAIVMGLQLLVVSLLKVDAATSDANTTDIPIRTLSELMEDKRFAIGMVTTTVSYALMTLIMNATPLEMNHHNHSMAATANVIQWHIVAMYLPSLFTGFIIEKFGYRRVLFTGCIALVACNIWVTFDTQFHNYLVGNILLGLGWNFLLVGGTVLISQVYREEERGRAQFANNFVVFLTNFVASAAAGALFAGIGWYAINSVSFVAIVITAIVVMRTQYVSKAN